MPISPQLPAWAGPAPSVNTQIADLNRLLNQVISRASYVQPGSIIAGDLSAGAVLTGSIATGAVTAGAIAAGAITAAAIAAGTITATQIAAGTITATQIAAGTITASNIQSGTITATQIAANTITSGNILANTIQASDIAANTITATQIAASTITTAEIAANTITAGDIHAGAITTTEIASATITAGNIAANTITSGNILANTITAGDIASHTITATQIAAGTITTTEIAADTILAGNIAANAITATELNAGAVTAGKIAANAVTAGTIAASAVTTATIAAGAVTATQIAANTITAGNIVAGTITSTELAANSVVAGKIAANAVTAGTIAANAVTTGTIAANAVTATQIAANTITSAQIAAGGITAGSLTITLGGANMLYDSSFYKTVANSGSLLPDWTPYQSTVVVDNTNIRPGPSTSAVAVTATASLTGIRCAQPIPVTPNTNYSLSAWFKAASTTRGCYVEVAWYTSGLADIVNPTGTRITNNTTGWVRPTLTVTSPSNAAFAYVYLLVESAAVGEVHYIDDAQFEQGDLPTAYGPRPDEVLPGTITGTQIASTTITGGKIATGTITATQIASHTITATQITAGTVTATELAANSVTATQIAANAVSTTQLNALSVTAAKIAASTITTSQIAASTITGGNIAANTITAGNIAANTITASQIAANTITAAQIASGTITSTQIAAGSITAGSLTITAGGNNMLYDSSFESTGTTTNWVHNSSGLSSAVPSTTYVHGGGQSMAVTIITGGPTSGTSLLYPVQANNVQVTPGDKVTISAYATGITSDKVRIYTRFWQSDNATFVSQVSGSDFSLAGNGTWVRPFQTLTVPATAGYMSCFLAVTAGVGGDVVYWDDVVFQVGDVLSPWSPRPDEILPGTITGTQIAGTTITGSNIVTGTVTAAQISSGTITTTQIAAGTITASNIATGTITATQLAANSVTATQLAANSVTAAAITAGTITATQIAANTLTATQIAADAITASELAANSVTASELAANAVTAGKINAAAVTAGTIAAGAISSSNLFATGVVTSTAIATGAVTATAINVSSLSAVSGTMGTVTGGIFQTGTSGARVMMGTGMTTPSGVSSGIIGIDAANNVTFSVDASSGNVALKGTLQQGSQGLGNIGGVTQNTILAISGNNLVTNGDMSSSSVSMWYVTGATLSYDRTVYLTAPASLAATATGTSVSVIANNAHINIPSSTLGTPYSGSAYVLTPNGESITVQMQFETSASAAVEYWQKLVPTVAGQWTRVALENCIAPSNLFVNPDAEVDTTGWAGANGTLSWDATQAYTGTHSVRIVSTVSSGTLGFPYQGASSTYWTPVTPGEIYSGGVMMKADATRTTSTGAQIYFYDASGVFINGSNSGTAGASVTLNTTWQLVRTAAGVVVPAGAAYARIIVTQTATAVGEGINADQMMLFKGDGIVSNPGTVTNIGFNLYFNSTTAGQVYRINNMAVYNQATASGGSIIAGSITATEIAAASITGTKIVANTITAGNIASGTITTTQIAAGTITGANIAGTTITAGNIAANTITATQIAANTITASQIASGTITTSQISVSAAITGSQIAGTTITGGNIATGTITATQIAANTITASQIASGTITTSQISVSAAITGAQLASAAGITGAQIAGTTITGGNIVTNTITATQIAANTITAAQIAANTITASQIASGTITTTQLNVAAGITGAQIAGTTITGSNLVTGTITATQIAANTITASQISTGTITSNEIANGTILAADIAAAAGIAGTQLAASAGITGTQIANTTISGGNIVTGTLTTTQIASRTILAGNIATGTLTANEIASGAITTSKLNVTMGGGNLAPNSSFNSITTNYGGGTSNTGYLMSLSGTGGTIGVSTSSRIPGTGYSLYTTSPASGGGSFSLENRDITATPNTKAPITPGLTYTNSIWVFPTVAGTYSLYIGFHATPTSSAITNPSVSQLCPANTWTRISNTAVAPAGADYASMYLYQAVVTPSCTVLVDDYQLEEGDVATAYAPATSEILPGTIVASQIAAGTITADRLTVSALTSTGTLAAGSVTTTAMTANTISGDRITANTLDASKIVAASISATQIASTSITADRLNVASITSTGTIAANAITSTQIQAGAVTTAAMTANAINGDRITAATLAATKIVSNSITATQIQTGTITTSLMTAGTINADRLTAGSITTALMTANTINGDRITASTLDASKIVANSITAGQIATGTITANEIQAGTIDASKINFTIDGNNSIANANFASTAVNGLYPWAAENSNTTLTAHAAGGAIQNGPYLTITAATTTGNVGVYQLVAVTGGEHYSISAYGWNSSISTALSYSITWLNASGATISTSTGALGTPPMGAWARVKTANGAPIVAPAGAVSAYVYFIYSALAAGNTFLLSNVKFESGDLATPWSQGVNGTVIDGASLTTGIITGGVVTGAVVQNVNTDPRVALDGTGVWITNSSSAKVLTLDSTNGLTLTGYPRGSAATTTEAIEWVTATGYPTGMILSGGDSSNTLLQLSTGKPGDSTRLDAGASLVLSASSATSPVNFINVTTQNTSGALTTKTILDGAGNSSFLQNGNGTTIHRLKSGSVQFTGNGTTAVNFTFPHGAGAVPISVTAMADVWSGYVSTYAAPDSTNIYFTATSPGGAFGSGTPYFIYYIMTY